MTVTIDRTFKLLHCGVLLPGGGGRIWEYPAAAQICRRLRFSSDADIVRLTNARIIINMGVRVSQVKPSNCFRRLEKLALPFISDKSFILDDVKLAELSNNSFE